MDEICLRGTRFAIIRLKLCSLWCVGELELSAETERKLMEITIQSLQRKGPSVYWEHIAPRTRALGLGKQIGQLLGRRDGLGSGPVGRVPVCVLENGRAEAISLETTLAG